MDEELAAIQKIVITLDARTPEEQGRILGYLFERFPITPLNPRQKLEPGDYYFVCGNGAIVFQRPTMGLRAKESASQSKSVAAFFGTWPGDETDKDLCDAAKSVREPKSRPVCAECQCYLDTLEGITPGCHCVCHD